MYLRQIAILFLICFSFFSGGQILEKDLLIKGDDVPLNITSGRVCVIISSTYDWQLLAERTHSNFQKMGIDAILYLSYKDLYGGQAVYRETLKLLYRRKIDLLFFLEENQKTTTLSISKLGNQNLIDLGTTSWYAEGSSMGEVVISLGVKMKAMDLSYNNFLIADFPEYLDHVPLFKGAHYKTYPSRLKKAPLAVALFPKISFDTLKEMSSSIRTTIDDYNAQIDEKNELLRNVFSKYSYKVDFIEDQIDKELYDNRYQFVLRYYRSTGKKTKMDLGYKMDESESNYVTTIPMPDGKRSMKTIPSSNYVYKFYIKQTAVGDVHVGRYYDAEENWEVALQNFISHMITQFEK
jgi:hypothetical protein